MKQSFATPIIEKAAKKLGVRIDIEPKYRYVGQITMASGRKIYFRGTNFDINPLGASEVAKDKAYAAYFMARLGYPVVEGREFFTDRWCAVLGSRRNMKAAYRYARSLGFPVIVKPNSKSQGSGVSLVHNQKELYRAVRALSRNENVFLVERVAVGNDYRIVVLDREVISAYQRLPLAVVGDSRSSIQKLLRDKQKEFRRIGRDTRIPIDDVRITIRLRRLGMTRRTVLPPGQRLELLANANLSTGGDAVDVTGNLHPQWRKLAAELTRDMNLRFCGVDVMAEGTLAEAPQKFVVLEINAAPGLDNYAATGPKQRRIVVEMYKQVLAAMLK